MLAELVQRHAMERPDIVLAVDPTEQLTNAEFDRQARALASWLVDHDVRQGDPVALCAHNSVRWLVANIGLIAGSALMAPMTYRTTTDELTYLLNHSGARVAIVDQSAAQVLQQVSSDLAHLEWVVAIDDALVEIEGARVIPWTEVVAHAPLPQPAKVAGTSMIFTSGTTGRPKGVYRPPSHGSSSSMGSFIPLFDLRPDDIHLCAGPLYHGGPHAFSILTLVLGGKVVILPKFDPEECLAAIEGHHVTTTFMVPTMLRLFTRHTSTQAHRFDTSTLRVIVTAGEPCPTPLKRDVTDLFGPVLYEFFGATELGINAVMPPEGHDKKPGSCGKVLAGQTFVVLDEKGQPLPAGEEGELAVANDTMPEYWKDSDATQAARRGELMTLGDTGYVDDEGYLYVTGRRVDLIKTGGVRVTPAEIEEVLLDHPDVLEVAVIGLPDDVWTERVTACVLPMQGRAPDPSELQEFCRARLASHKVPKQVELFDAADWPRLENGKVPKRLLKDRLVEQGERTKT
jgi:acyl-coenzyme A synthetase/AMP-(fatty) acid ligase